LTGSAQNCKGGRLRPMFRYYGSKWRLVPKYPAPEHDRIIEPFAGGAAYSLMYPHLEVVLYEKNPLVARAWQYIIGASEDELMGIPDIGIDQTVHDLGLCEGARLLVGAWLNNSEPRFQSLRPCKRMRGHMSGEHEPPHAWPDGCYWGPVVRSRIASQASKIRHWRVVNDDYRNAENDRATWFVDPPYNNSAGARYTCGATAIDYSHLADWCRSRRGQTIVCENAGADWLPFEPFAETLGFKHGRTKEVVWVNNSGEPTA